MVLRVFKIFGICCLLSTQAAAQIDVSVTIKPLQLIAAAITDDTVLVLRPSQDPHNYALRPSERRALNQAQILLWIGPSMETFLPGIIDELEAEVITAIELDEIHLLSNGRVSNPHIWFDTFNARIIARSLSQTLSKMDTSNALRYRQNLQTFESKLDVLDESIEKQMAEIRALPYGVYHNAFQYFEAQFGLEHVVSFTDNQELQPGIKKLLNVKSQLENSNANCILLDPSVNIEELSSIIENESMRYATYNEVGRDIPVGKDGYVNLIEGLADSLNSCLR